MLDSGRGDESLYAWEFILLKVFFLPRTWKLLSKGFELS